MLKDKKNSISERPITPAMEDYLEAIYDLGKEKRSVRVKDIAKRLNVKMPTVTNMLKSLAKRGLIEYEKYEYLELSDEGDKVGREIHRRHKILCSFLADILKIDRGKADDEACSMEHGISHDTLDRLVSFMEFLQSCPRAGLSWLDNFDEFRLHGTDKEKCMGRIQKFSNGLREKIDCLEDRGAKFNDFE